MSKRFFFWVVYVGLAVAVGAGIYEYMLFPNWIQGLARDLGSKDDQKKEVAQKKLRQLGPRAVGPLISELKPPSYWKRRARAARALATLGSHATKAVPALLGRLKDFKWQVRLEAIRALGRVGAKDKKVVQALAKTLSAKNVEQGQRKVKKAAVKALARIGTAQAIRELIGALRQKALRGEAAHALVRLGEAAIPALLQALQYVHNATRLTATAILARIGQPALTGLSLALHDKNYCIIRKAAARALALMGEKAAGAIPALLRALDDASCSRHKAEQALARIGNEAVPPLLKLIPTLPPKEKARRASVARVFGRMGPKATEVLLPPLQHKDWKTRWVMARALGFLEEPSTVVIASLRRTLSDPHPQVRAQAAASLGNWEKRSLPAIPDLLKLVGDPKVEVRLQAIRSLGKLGAAAEAAVPLLIRSLREKEASLRQETARALGRIGAKAARAVYPLRRLLRDGEKKVVLAAIRALGQIGPEAKAALYSLRRLLKKEWAQAAAQQAIQQIQHKEKEKKEEG